MRRKLNLSGVIIFLIGLLMLGSVQTQSVQAQVGGTLQYGDVVTGEITDAEPEQSYVFEGNTDDILVILLVPEDADSELEPRVTITAPDGNELLVAVDIMFQVETALRLPVDGKYTLTVSRSGGENGVTTGPYQLTLLLPELLDIGDSVTDTIESTETHYYSLLGYSTFRLIYTRQSGTFGPEVAITSVEVENELVSLSLAGLNSIARMGGSDVIEAMVRIDHDYDAFVITVGKGFLDFSIGTTPATYTVEISE